MLQAAIIQDCSPMLARCGSVLIQPRWAHWAYQCCRLEVHINDVILRDGAVRETRPSMEVYYLNGLSKRVKLWLGFGGKIS
jgi:hypothetical protein